MLRTHLTSIRGQLVLWYLGILAILLLALGTFQTLQLGSYLRSTTEDSVRHSASQEMALLGPCYLRSGHDLRANAGTLAHLLGGHGTAVTVVTPGGIPLAHVAASPFRDAHLPHLSRSTIKGLVASAGVNQTPGNIRVARCPQPHAPRGRRGIGPRGRAGSSPLPALAPSLVTGGNTLLVAVPLRGSGHVLGYAILERSIASANATVTREMVVFALGALAALLLAGLVALPLIERALRPLRRVAKTAEAIAAGNLEQRAHLAHSRDEIGRLGEAFDTMVDRLQAAIAATTASEERMRTFLADASHELRTPVTVLRGASQVLLRQGLAERPEMLATLQDMHEESIRLSRLIDDLLTLTRLDTGQTLHPQPVVLNRMLPDFVERYSAVWPERTLYVDVPDEPVWALVDGDALRRIVTNLVDNAARYSRAGGAIGLRARRDGAHTALEIEDEGPGLKPEDAARVFDRFYRANKSRSRDSGGTGLGLAIVRGLVEQSGGEIAIDTAPERGTIVHLRLPRAPVPEAARPEPDVVRA